MNDRIEKRIELKAPVSRVWRALTDYREFGEWFRVKLEGPFVAGKEGRGEISRTGYEHLQIGVVVQKDRAGAVVFVYLASLCDRSEDELLAGASDAGGVHDGEE